MKRRLILFQGDSITETGRHHNMTERNALLGSGYVTMVSGKLCAENPDIDVLNHAVGGFRIADMYGRWQEETLNVEYDLLSILCGINDIGFGIRLGRGSDAERFEFIYDRMIYEALEANPNGKIILCQPFIFRRNLEGTGIAAEFNNDIYRDWDMWSGEMKRRQEVVLRLVQKYNTMYAPFGDALEKAQETAPVERWTRDCIHTTVAGDYIMAQTWLEATKDYFEKVAK